MNTPHGINLLHTLEHDGGNSCDEVAGASKDLYASSLETRTDSDVLVQPSSSSSCSPPTKKKCLVSPGVEAGLQLQEQIVPLPLDVQHFMSNINITVSDYISQQYLVRGSPSYKVLKDKIREYCLSLKPSGMKDDTSCSVLYLVYQSLPELKRTDEADSIIRKMIGKHIRNAKYRAKCKLRECKLTEADKSAAIINKSESFANCASWVTMLQAEINRNKESSNLDLSASNLSELRNTLTANLASLAPVQPDQMPLIPSPMIPAGLTVPKVALPGVQHTNNIAAPSAQLPRPLTSSDISSIIQNGSLAGSPVQGVNASPGRAGSSSYTSPVQLLYNTLQGSMHNSSALHNSILHSLPAISHMPTVIPNSSGLMHIGGEQMQIKRERDPNHVDVMSRDAMSRDAMSRDVMVPNTNNQVFGNQMSNHINIPTANKVLSTPLTAPGPPPTASRPVSVLTPRPPPAPTVLTPRPPPAPTPRRSSSESEHMNAMSRDSDVSHVNKVCNHKLKFISSITYACINCNDYFERLSPQRLACEYCKKQFTHKHLLLQHNNEVHASLLSQKN